MASFDDIRAALFRNRDGRLVEERRRRRRAAADQARRDAQARNAMIADARRALGRFLAGEGRLALPPPAGDVDVSIVIVVWNQPHLLLRCLQAVLAQHGPTYEVILVDNNSAAPTRRFLGRLDGPIVLRNRENEGFLRACNQGARHARGRALLMLNSDAFMHAEALANAFRTLVAHPEVGAVGGRLIHPWGRLQEAGCEVHADATTTGVCRGMTPDCEAAMTRRDVDYCSGAFLMIRRSAWEELRGFDDGYAPGYYEDADFCLRLREAGYRVVVEPGVAVDHVERGSEAARGDALRTSLRNLELFRLRHAKTLASQPRRAAPKAD